MFELSIEKYPRVIPLMEGLKCDTVFALSVIENKQKGFIFVDDIDKPGCALVVHYCSGYALIMGCSNNKSFNKELIDLISSKKMTRPHQIKIIIPDENWGNIFSPLSGQGDWFSDYSRVKFSFNKEKFDAYISSKPKLPNDYKILRITKDLFGKIEGTVVPKAFWENEGEFMDNGAGFVLMKNNYVISSAFSAYICNSMIDIGIETNKDFRGQDFGSYAAIEMINYCLKYRYEPIWGARSNNTSSIRLAEKLGFEKVMEFPIVVVS